MKKTIFIIHFHPVEMYPPVMNMIDYLSLNSGCRLIVVTNKKSKSSPLLPYQPEANVKIYRPAIQTSTVFIKHINYLFFYLTSICLLLKYHPVILFYFETLSSWPAMMYKKLKGKQVQLMVHYHEYTEPKLYKEGMFF